MVVAVCLVKVLNGLGGDGFNGFVNAIHGYEGMGLVLDSSGSSFRRVWGMCCPNNALTGGRVWWWYTSTPDKSRISSSLHFLIGGEEMNRSCFMSLKPVEQPQFLLRIPPFFAALVSG